MKSGTTEKSGKMEGDGHYLDKLDIYETHTRFVILGHMNGKRGWRLLKIDRTEPEELNFTEDPMEYSDREVKDLLLRLSQGNKSVGGLQFRMSVFGIIGFVKFLSGYYMIVVKQRELVGNVCGHTVFRVTESEMLPIAPPGFKQAPRHEQRYKKLFCLVDLSREFYYSHTYPLMRTLQQNALGPLPPPQAMPMESMFVWNAFLSRPLRAAVANTRWTLSLVHGFFKQYKWSVYGKNVVVTIIARRSRHYAGTRYLKRGLNDAGKVANDVETEQIVADDEGAAGMEQGQVSSATQMRGSIPLFWSQTLSQLQPKPDITLQYFDPFYAATALHFQDLERRYGNSIIILNLVKTVEKRPREMILRRAYAQAVVSLNQQLPEERKLKFIHWDLNSCAKRPVVSFLSEISVTVLDQLGIFYSGRPAPSLRRHIHSQRRERLARQQGRALEALRKNYTNAAAVAPRTPPPRLPLRHLVEVSKDLGRRSLSLDLYAQSNESGGAFPLSSSFDASSPSPSLPSTTFSGENRGTEEGVPPSPASSILSSLSDMVDLRRGGGGGSGVDRGGKKEGGEEGPGASTTGTGQTAPAQEKMRMEYSRAPMFQHGILRTNCIDCLDRTNVAQYAYGMVAFGRQLVALGMTEDPRVDPDSSAGSQLIEAYQEMGDSIAIQYGGSTAHVKVYPEGANPRMAVMTQSQEVFKSIRRYISNVISDRDKQDGMNLFLGHFRPHAEHLNIWELESDYYLHVHSAEIADDTPQGPFEPDSLASSLRIPGLHQEEIALPEPGMPRLITFFDELVERQGGLTQTVSTSVGASSSAAAGGATTSMSGSSGADGPASTSGSHPDTPTRKFMRTRQFSMSGSPASIYLRKGGLAGEDDPGGALRLDEETGGGLGLDVAAEEEELLVVEEGDLEEITERRLAQLYERYLRIVQCEDDWEEDDENWLYYNASQVIPLPEEVEDDDTDHVGTHDEEAEERGTEEPLEHDDDGENDDEEQEVEEEEEEDGAAAYLGPHVVDALPFGRTCSSETGDDVALLLASGEADAGAARQLSSIDALRGFYYGGDCTDMSGDCDDCSFELFYPETVAGDGFRDPMFGDELEPADMLAATEDELVQEYKYLTGQWQH